MKIYFYDTETGIYQGEGFADLGFEDKRWELPVGATAIAPPPYRSGEVPVFQAASQCWELRCCSTQGGERTTGGGATV